MLLSIFYIGLIKVTDDWSWMYQDSPEGLHMMNYCNGFGNFINYALSNPEILVEAVLDVYVRDIKIKSFLMQIL